MARHVRRFVATLPLLVLIACRSASSSRTEPAPRLDVITHEELQRSGLRNAHEVVERLRPRWLMVRSGMRSFALETEVVVFQGQLFLGTPEVLHRIGLDGIYEIRYLDGATAKATLPGLGSRHVQGAIVIHMSPQGP
jgi:hypothetical protein